MHKWLERTMRREIALLLLLGAACGPAAYAQEDAGPALPAGDTPPPTAFSRLADAGGADDHPDFHHVVVHDRTVNRVDDRGVTSTETYTLSKVLDAEGCRKLSALRWGFDPQSKWVDVREVNLIRDGARIPVDVNSVLELPAPQSMIYWNDRIKLLQLPRLRIGDGIEVRTFQKGFMYALLDSPTGAASGGGSEPDGDRFIPPMPGEYFDIALFQSSVPMLEKRYEVHLPLAKRLHAQVYNGPLYSSTTYDAEKNVYAWWGFDLPAQPDEPRQPDHSDIVTKVVMATVESWEAKSRWFFAINDAQFDSNPEIDAKVRQILQEAGVAGGSDDEKAEVLLHWVAQNIRYSGQTMGRGEGFTLHTGTMIFDQRSGVCKDIAGMLVTMMRSAGIPTYAAMTMAGSRIEEVPADQFNHCVVARQTEDGWVMYDPTWVPYNNDIWSKLETEQHYLIGSPEGEPLSRIAYSPPQESPLRLRHDARLLPDGTLEGTMRFEGKGALDGRLRRMVARHPRRRLNDQFAAVLAPMCPAVEGVQVRHRVPDDFSGDMWIEVRYRAPGFAVAIGDGLEFTDPAMAVLIHQGALFRAGEQTWEDERETDILLYNTQLVDAEETIRLPRGFKATLVPGPTEVDETYALFKGYGEAQDGRLVIRSRAEVRRRQIPPDGYEGFVAAMRAVRDWSQEMFRVERKGDER
ncbi:MAG: DUF3857 domain-containing transglutaminase family protein [Planctomycetota bacterium]